MKPHCVGKTFAIVALALLAGCSQSPPDDGIKFLNVKQSQTAAIDDFSKLVFTDAEGNAVSLSDAMTSDYLVMVVTRGWSQSICLYCASQTSKWARRYDELAPYNAQLVVVFPTETKEDAARLDDLTDSIKGGKIPNDDIPFPILLDINLKTVDQLGIRSELAKPATYIIDRQGRVRFAYVGESVADRPSVDAVLQQLSLLNSAT